MAFRLSLVVALIGLLVLLAISRPARAEPIEIHYAPVENLEHLDVELLRSARSKINMAAYSLTDWAIADALIEAHKRGVAIRIVLDPGQQHALDRLREITGDIRMKARGRIPICVTHMWTAPMASTFLTLRAIWSAAVICPACRCRAYVRWP
jgi:phosphatidylserine/phosphatidylglycerophosphate/cardiolipin synthase-like enzyme